jgi:hypothetical protein
MELPLYKTVIGLRHKRLFAFSANSGSLIDYLVDKYPKSKNGTLFFSKISWKPDRLGVRLINDLGNFALDIDIDGLVISYNYTVDDVINAESIAKNFDELLPDCLKYLGASKLVNRIGIINYYSFDEKRNAASELSERLLNIKLNGIADTFTLRFSLKNPTEETLVRTDTLDYTNVIFLFNSERIEEGNKSSRIIDINIDYQMYYSPEETYRRGMIIEHQKMFNKYVFANKIDELINFKQLEG